MSRPRVSSRARHLVGCWVEREAAVEVGDECAEQRVGEPALEAAHGFHRRLALGSLAQVVLAAGAVVLGLDECGDVQRVVQAPVAAAVDVDVRAVSCRV